MPENNLTAMPNLWHPHKRKNQVKILLVDDEAVIRQAVGDFLSRTLFWVHLSPAEAEPLY